MSFFMWSQNNSGGHFTVNDDLTLRVTHIPARFLLGAQAR
jgi:hypothetical protein